MWAILRHQPLGLGNWLRTITSDRTVHNTQSLRTVKNYCIRIKNYLRDNKFIVRFAWVILEYTEGILQFSNIIKLFIFLKNRNIKPLAPQCECCSPCNAIFCVNVSANFPRGSGVRFKTARACRAKVNCKGLQRICVCVCVCVSPNWERMSEQEEQGKTHTHTERERERARENGRGNMAEHSATQATIVRWPDQYSVRSILWPISLFLSYLPVLSLSFFLCLPFYLPVCFPLSLSLSLSLARLYLRLSLTRSTASPSAFTFLEFCLSFVCELTTVAARFLAGSTFRAVSRVARRLINRRNVVRIGFPLGDPASFFRNRRQFRYRDFRTILLLPQLIKLL